MIAAFLTWLEHGFGKGPTPDGQSFSELLLGSLNFWSLLEGTHLIVLMLFAGTILVVDLRLLGVTFRKTKVSTISDAILPLTIYSFIFVVISGVGLLFAKPIFYYHTIWFLVKMVFLALALLNIVVFHGRVQATQGSWDADEVPPRAARMSAAASLVLWTLVIICGRFIPYNWYECGKPQPAVSSMNLEHFFPQAKAWVETLGDIPPGSWVKGPQFGYASWEVGHIISLIMIGGTTILMNLRLLGAGVTQEKPAEIYKNLRVLQNIGVIGIIVTGVLIGAANAVKLYDSSAFTVKMMALLSGLILTYGVSRPVAAANGAVGLMPKIWFAIGGAIFLTDVWMFSTTDLIDVGIYHVITAAALILIPVTRGRLRWAYIGGMVVLIVAQFAHTHFVIKADDYDHLNPVNKAYTVAYGVWIVGTGLITLFRGRGEEGGPLTKLVAYSTMLVWVLGAAAGRWIAFQ